MLNFNARMRSKAAKFNIFMLVSAVFSVFYVVLVSNLSGSDSFELDSQPILDWKCATRCCSKPMELINPYYSNSSLLGITINDRLTPIDFKQLADFHFSCPASLTVWQRMFASLWYGSVRKLDQPAGFGIRSLTRETISCLEPGAVIFVDQPNISYFQSYFLKFITVPFVLITGDGDETPCAATYTSLVRHKLIIHWYGMNCGMNPNPLKFSCLFNGISQWNGQRDSMQKAYTQELQDQTGMNHKNSSHLALFSMTVKNNPDRQILWDLACNPQGKLADISFCFFDPAISQLEMYSRIGTSKFIYSPAGAGLDCYRTYEALYLGSYPIIKSSSLNEMFLDLPVLIINDWNELNEELLLTTLEKFQTKQWNFDVLYKGYWYEKFRSYGFELRRYVQSNVEIKEELLYAVGPLDRFILPTREQVYKQHITGV